MSKKISLLSIQIPLLLPLMILVLFIIYFFCISTVSAGQIGIVTLFGKVQDELLSPGIHLLNPFTNVHKLDIKVQTTKGVSEAASNDLQRINTEITLNYSFDGTKAKHIYTNLGDNEQYIEISIINPAMSEAFKQVVAEYTAEQLITKRDIVSLSIQKILQNRLVKYGVLISNISITDFKFSATFNQAIEDKMIAQQRVQTAQNKLAEAKVNAEQLIITAQAQANAMKTQQQVLTADLLHKMAIEKWDGHLPSYMGTSLPFIQGGIK